MPTYNQALHSSPSKLHSSHESRSVLPCAWRKWPSQRRRASRGFSIIGMTPCLCHTESLCSRRKCLAPVIPRTTFVATIWRRIWFSLVSTQLRKYLPAELLLCSSSTWGALVSSCRAPRQRAAFGPRCTLALVGFIGRYYWYLLEIQSTWQLFLNEVGLIFIFQVHVLSFPR